ncbi:MAG: hypothetical protein JNM72_05355 [Deltaproteobacteria bacterium]|jgi:hypothetical protein|nr:hypothetical protein [Deltaproteobacteria bacterium]
MSLLEYMKRDADLNAEAEPPDYAKKYYDLLKELAQGIEVIHPGEIEATVRRTPVAGGWEVLVWPWKQAETRISLIAAYPSEESVQMYNRIYTSKESFERALQEFWSSPTTKECLAGLRERSTRNVEGWLRVNEGQQPVLLTLMRADFRTLANGSEGDRFEGHIRQEPYQRNPRTGPPSPPLEGSAEFSRHLIRDAQLVPNTADDGDRWPFLLQGTRGPTPRRPYATA